MATGDAYAPPAAPLLRNPRVRSLVFQILLVLAVVGVAALLGWMAWSNLARANVASGFGFWNEVAGFDISQTLIDYSSSTSTYGRAFWVGLAQHPGGGRASASCWRPSSASSSASRGCRATGWWRISRPATSSSSATCRCCSSCCSGTTRCSRRCRSSATASRCAGGGYLNNRGLYLPTAGSRRQRRHDPRRIRRRSRGRDRAWPCWRAGGVIGAGAAAACRRRCWCSACRLATFLASGATLTFEFPEIEPVQPERRHRGAARVRRAGHRPRDLHRRVHRRDGAGRAAGGAARPDRGRAGARAVAPA